MTAMPQSIADTFAASPTGVPKLALTSRELAQALGVSVKSIERRRAAGEDLPPSIVLGDQTRRYPTHLVIAWLEKQCQNSGT